MRAGPQGACAAGRLGRARPRRVAAPAGATPGEDPYGLVVLGMGIGLCAWVTGLTGAVTAVAHRRWVVRVLGHDGSRRTAPAAG